MIWLGVLPVQGTREAKRRTGKLFRARLLKRKKRLSRGEKRPFLYKSTDIFSCSPSTEMLMQGFFQFEFTMLVEGKVGLGRAFTRRNIYQVALVVGLHLSR